MLIGHEEILSDDKKSSHKTLSTSFFFNKRGKRKTQFLKAYAK